MASGLQVTSDQMIAGISCRSCGAFVGVALVGNGDAGIVGCEHFTITTMFLRDRETGKLHTLSFVPGEPPSVQDRGILPMTEKG